MLVALGWWYLAPHATQDANFAQHGVSKKVDGVGTARRGNVPEVLKQEQAIKQDGVNEEISTPAGETQETPVLPPSNVAKQPGIIANLKTADKGVNAVNASGDNINQDKNNNATALLDQPKQLLLRTTNFNLNAKAADIRKKEIMIATVGATVNEYKKADDKGWLKKPMFAVTVLASSDVNGLSSFSMANTGQNVGLLFSTRFNKLSITTGAYYSYKPYTVPFAAYNPTTTYKFRNTPQSVTADCRMLDIPLNIDYQIFAKNNNAISIGTGISSFIMLKENYKYNYSNASAYGVSTYNVKDPDKYLFSSVNLQANYRRQINSKIGLNVMPYLKIPLNDIGYSKVKLQTMGVAVGLNWNINPLQKPK